MRIGGGAVSIADVTDRVARDLGFVRPFWLNEIRAGRAFIRGAAVGASGGNFTEIQLFNPIGSGITIIGHRLLFSSGATEEVRLTTFNTALATLVGAGINLLAGGAAGVGEVRSAVPAAIDGTLVMPVNVLINTPVTVIDDWFFELGAAEGIITVPNVVNTSFRATYMWIEL